MEGIPGGISSGAAVAAALELAVRDDMAGKTIVAIVPSFAERLPSTALFEGLWSPCSVFAPRHRPGRGRTLLSAQAAGAAAVPHGGPDHSRPHRPAPPAPRARPVRCPPAPRRTRPAPHQPPHLHIGRLGREGVRPSALPIRTGHAAPP